MTPLPYTSPDHQLLHQFLVEEGHLLDTFQLERWYALLAPEIRYVMPVAVTTMAGDASETARSTMDHFYENAYSLGKRVERLLTDSAWTEDPRSRVRRHIGNVRSACTDEPERWNVESSVLVFRSRGDRRPPELVSAGRSDVIRRTPDGLRLAARTITIDEAVVRTQNLAILL